MSKNLSKNSNSGWSYCIRNLIFQKKPREAILTYKQNRGSSNVIILGVIPLVLKACASISMLSLGRALHCETIKLGVTFNVMVGTSLVDMYGKCRDVVSARKMFDFMPNGNAVTWNAMIGGYIKNGDTKSANILFEKMAGKTSVTWNEMIDGYAKSGDMVMARQVFNNVPEGLKTVVTWTVMVDGYASHGDMEAAKEMFEKMTKRNFYIWSVMISGYFKKGDVDKARGIFYRMSERNLVVWNSLISGYVQNGMCEEAMEAFKRMQVDCFEPDEVTIASILSACAQLGQLDVGKEIHEMIVSKRIALNEFVLNGLADMYAKCGDLSQARLIFEQMSFKNYAAWNVLISGFAINGHCREAVDFFSRMEKSKVKPDEVTFLSVLFACAHGGLVEEGLDAFYKMEKYGLTANIKHFGCLVDLLARAGKLQEAFDLVKEMPVEPNDTILGALLGACRIHSNTVMAERVLELVGKLNSGCISNDDAHYVLLSNIYAASERWQKAEGIRVVFSNKGLEKAPGCSTVMVI
ncbi:pentatricopeptide repeat-containing protein At3g21470 [Olea europaea var. sylvestris]|uniref:pentatricopeptide repeat-containing protein At3g21470 n=1 Tax=Olea europaea var. sylvestris TaxID=158386 RepID=UPI000C1D3D9C|nr:pentatricopeptide repeat-containing protein At3g21470 [Olea europaea var. sylvestris]XP_022850311.1 pentatricopeptide repeat-containing protein At3g21470 [Olea europaea var. sylvestris]